MKPVNYGKDLDVQDGPSAKALDCRLEPVVHALYEKLGRAVISRVERIVGRRTLAQEILQETFTRLWTLGPSFESELAAFAWVYKTSHNLAVDHQRSAYSRTALAADEAFIDMPARGTGPDEQAEQQQLLARCFARLSAEEASVFTYKIVDHMTHEEIGGFIGASGKTVSRMLAKIERKLANIKVAIHDEAKL